MIKHEPIPNGYIITRRYRGQNRSVKVIGAGLEDITFSQVGLGCINITRLKAAVAANKVPYDRQILAFTRAQIKMFLDNRDIDAARVREILMEDRKFMTEPVLALISDGGHHLIDGNHRIAAHLAIGMAEVRAYVIPIAAIDPYRVKLWIDGILYEENELDLRASFGMHMDKDGNVREP
jgi:hypothetical protein